MPQTGTTTVNGSFRPGAVDGSNGPASEFRTFARSVAGLFNVTGPVILPGPGASYDQAYPFVINDVPVWDTDQAVVVDVTAINSAGSRTTASDAFIIQGKLDPPANPIEVVGGVAT